jgi:hypothetical protein
MPKRTPIAFDEAEFETDERPTQPGAPTLEALEAMREAAEPKRARVRPRARPALAPATQSWLQVKTSLGAPLRTATSRIRAVASVLLEGGAGRASLVDEDEAASTEVVPRESGARRIPTVRPPVRERGPTGTMKMPARPPRMLAQTVLLPARARARRWRGVRAWLVAVGAGVLCVIAAGVVLREARGNDVQAGAASAPTVVAATPSPSPSVPAVEPPTSIDLPFAAPVVPSSSSPVAAPRVRGRAPARRAPPQTGSAVF